MTHATHQAGGEQGLADQASAKVQDAASSAQEKAAELREQGSVQLRDQFDQRSSEAGAQMRSLAEALRRSGNDLNGEGRTDVSQLTSRAADRIERLGGYLEQKSGDEFMSDIETFARRRPWMLAGFGMLAGVAAARFVKASSEHRYGEYRRAGGPQWANRQGMAANRGALPPASSDRPLTRDPYASTR